MKKKNIENRSKAAKGVSFLVILVCVYASIPVSPAYTAGLTPGEETEGPLLCINIIKIKIENLFSKENHIGLPAVLTSTFLFQSPVFFYKAPYIVKPFISQHHSRYSAIRGPPA